MSKTKIKWMATAILFMFPFLRLFGEGSPKGYIEMPPAKDGSYLLGGKPGDNRRWGRPETIKALMLVAREWNRRYQGKYKIVIGDISKKDGSHFPPHKTHKDGLRVDIVTRPNICSVNFKDQKITLELARLFVRFGAWRIFYNHPYVYKKMPQVSKLVKHDDHFHVEFDPKRVPQSEGPFVIPAPPVTENSYVGTKYCQKGTDGYTGLVVRWTYLGTSPRWQREYQVELRDNAGKLLFITEKLKGNRTFFKLPFPLSHNKKYQWRVQVWGRKKSLTTGLIPFQTDFTPPKVEPLLPAPGDEVDSLPKFQWKYKDSESTQQSFEIQLDTNRSHKKISWTSGEQISSKDFFEMPFDLRPKRHYYWRVVVSDGRGNQAASEWTKFYVKKKKRFKPQLGKVISKSLNLRKGPGTRYLTIGRLFKGQEVLVLRRINKWYYVRIRKGSGFKYGYVHGDYIQLKTK